MWILELTNKLYHDKQKLMMWKCKCDCGNEVNVASSHLIRGSKTSGL